MQKREGVAEELRDGSDGEYFRLLEAASNRQNIRNNVLTIYDRMVRDEIQIKAERDYAVKEAVEEARAEALAEGLEQGKAVGLEQGRAEVLRIAAEMKARGQDISLLADYLGLSEKDIF